MGIYLFGNWENKWVKWGSIAQTGTVPVKSGCMAAKLAKLRRHTYFENQNVKLTWST